MSDDHSWDRCQEGTASPEDLEQLKQQLSTAEGRRAWMLERELETDLRERFALESAKDSRQNQARFESASHLNLNDERNVSPQPQPKANVETESPSSFSRLHSGPSFFRYWGIGLTAALVTLVCIATFQMGWLKPPSKNRHVAQVLTVEGEVRVKRGPIHAALRPGMSLKEDDHLVNDDRGHVHFEFTDGTQVKVGAGARWHLGNESHEHGRVFQIAAGTAWFAVQPQTHPMVVRTPNADVEILGTRLSVHVEGELTAVDLYEGQVLLHDETQRLELEAQQAVDISGAGWVPRAARALQDVVVEVVEVSQGGCRLKSFDASLDLGTFKVAFPSVVNTNVEARLMEEKLRIFSLEPGERGKVNLEWGPTWVMSDWNANEVGVQ